MKYCRETRKLLWISIILTLCVIGLTACDSNEKIVEEKRVDLTGPAKGVLMDSIVSGVSYHSSSGKKGITDEQGTFNYNHGDTIEFKLGSLSLGNVKGKSIVTPIELANGDEKKLHNLLVLLQSLDSDSDLSNDISITSDTAKTVSAKIKLNHDPEKFATSQAFLALAEENNFEPIALEEAQAHFLSQGTTILSNHVWVQFDNSSANVIRIAGDGSNKYIVGIATPDDSCDENRVCGGKTIIKAGLEYGIAKITEFDTRGFVLTGTPEIDTNLKAGLSHPGPTRRIHSDGLELIASDIVTVQREREQSGLFGELFHVASPIEISDENEPILKEVKENRFSKMDNDPSGIVGAWVLDNTSVKTKTFLFFSNKKFMLIDPTGDTNAAETTECGKPGIEYADYDYHGDTKTLAISGYLYDTNGCAGFSDVSGGKQSFEISTDGNSAILTIKGEEPITLYRVIS